MLQITGLFNMYLLLQLLLLHLQFMNFFSLFILNTLSSYSLKIFIILLSCGRTYLNYKTDKVYDFITKLNVQYVKRVCTSSCFITYVTNIDYHKLPLTLIQMECYTIKRCFQFPFKIISEAISNPFLVYNYNV